MGLRGGQAPRFLTTAAQRCVVIDKAQPEARPKWHVGTRPIPPAWGQRRTLQTLADTGSPLRGRNLAVSTVDGAASRTRPAAPLVSTTHGPLKCVSRTPSMSSSPPSERRRRSSSRPTMHVPSHIGSDIADDCIRARCFGGNSKPARHHLCPLDRRHPCTHVRGIGTVRRDERQLTFGIGFRSVVVGPVTRFCGRGGT